MIFLRGAQNITANATDIQASGGTSGSNTLVIGAVAGIAVPLFAMLLFAFVMRRRS